MIILVRLDFKTGSDPELKHNQRISNWHKPFFKYDCFSDKEKKEDYDSKMTWFDQGVWYMLTHLDLFFAEVGLAAKIMAFIHFLSDKAKETVLDHITFYFIHERILEACLNLYDDPHTPMLTENMNTRMGIMIEKLIKITMFTDKLLSRNDNPHKR